MVEAITWVFNRSTSRKFDRLVLLTLANHLNKETFTAWPGIATLAQEAGISEHCVKVSLRSLRSIGELQYSSRIINGACTSNEYRLPRFDVWFQEHCKLKSDSIGVGPSGPQGGPSRPQGGAQGAYNPVTEPIHRTKEEKTTAQPAEHCLCCGTTANLTRDHIVPRSMGGSDDPINLQTLCINCNSAKGQHISFMDHAGQIRLLNYHGKPMVLTLKELIAKRAGDLHRDAILRNEARDYRLGKEAEAKRTARVGKGPERANLNAAIWGELNYLAIAKAIK